MDPEKLTDAVIAVGDTIRQHTDDANEAIRILAAALTYESTNSKVPDCSWKEHEEYILQIVASMLSTSREAIEKTRVNG